MYTEIHIKDLEIGKPIEPTRILCCFCQMLHTLNLKIERRAFAQIDLPARRGSKTAKITFKQHFLDYIQRRT